MDREIDLTQRRLASRKRLLLIGALLGLGALAIYWGAGLLKPTVHRARIRLATVEREALEATVQASGTVVPASERVLSSPAEVRVLQLLKRAGERVSAGEPILELDTSEIESRLNSIEDKLAQNRSAQQQAAVAFEDRSSELTSNIEIQKLELEISRYRLEQKLKLNRDGLIAEEELKQAEVEVRRSEIQLSRMQDSVSAAARSHEADGQRLELDADLLRKERGDVRRQLERATTRSPIDGVLTWVADEIGSTVSAGTIIARIADLRSFRIEAQVSDAYASRLAVAQPVRVKMGDLYLDATLTSILPTVEGGALKFEVGLTDPDHEALRHNMRLDLFVVTERRDDVLRLPRAPFIQTGGMKHQVFVVENDRARRVDVQIGLSGHDYLEIRDGLTEGDVVIISDMSTQLHARELRIK
jgi:HlyD family secretion protein